MGNDASFAVFQLVLNKITQSLATYNAQLAQANADMREAAVALILRQRSAAPDLSLIHI